MIGYERIPAHKAIISSKCEYFAAMLKNGWQESAGKIVRLNHVSSEEFKLIMQYIYTGEMTVKTVPTSLTVLELSKLYLLKDLQNLIESQFKANLSLDNVFIIIKSACEMKLESICKICYEFLNYNLYLLPEEGYNELTYEAWEFILEARTEIISSVIYIEVDEIHIFKNLLNWANTQNMDVQDERVQYLFSKIRFNMMNSIDLIGTVRRSNVYDINFLLDALEKKLQKELLYSKLRLLNLNL